MTDNQDIEIKTDYMKLGNAELEKMIRENLNENNVGSTLTLTPQQKDELSQQINKIKDDYQPNYEPFYKLKDEGADSKPAIALPVAKNDWNFDLDKIICTSCMCVVYKPLFCGECFYPVCTACRKMLDKNDEKNCLSCV